MQKAERKSTFLLQRCMQRWCNCWCMRVSTQHAPTVPAGLHCDSWPQCGTPRCWPHCSKPITIRGGLTATTGGIGASCEQLACDGSADVLKASAYATCADCCDGEALTSALAGVLQMCWRCC
eukprot:354678-Chlamydomonas_euryale.AAC.2